MVDFSDLIGVPFKEFGRDPRTGLDCYGLVIEVAKRYGKTLCDVAAHRFTVEQADKEADLHLNVCRTDDLMRPCIGVEFRGVDGRLHIGVTIDDKGTFLQATENQGVRMSTLDSCRGYLRVVRGYEILDTTHSKDGVPLTRSGLVSSDSVSNHDTTATPSLNDRPVGECFSGAERQKNVSNPPAARLCCGGCA